MNLSPARFAGWLLALALIPLVAHAATATPPGTVYKVTTNGSSITHTLTISPPDSHGTIVATVTDTDSGVVVERGSLGSMGGFCWSYYSYMSHLEVTLYFSKDGATGSWRDDRLTSGKTGDLTRIR